MAYANFSAPNKLSSCKEPLNYIWSDMVSSSIIILYICQYNDRNVQLLDDWNMRVSFL